MTEYERLRACMRSMRVEFLEEDATWCRELFPTAVKSLSMGCGFGDDGCNTHFVFDVDGMYLGHGAFG